MFDIEVAFTIAKVIVSAKDEDGTIERTVRLTLEREFDVEAAAAIGKEANRAREALETGAMQKAVFGIGRIKARCKLVAPGQGARAKPDTITIDPLLGRRATCTAGTKEDDPVTMSIEFECSYRDDVWAFLGRNCLASAMVTLTKLQLEFPEAA
jgi:hypothetical protein